MWVSSAASWEGREKRARSFGRWREERQEGYELQHQELKGENTFSITAVKY